MQYGIKTDVGCTREHNEDTYRLCQYHKADVLIVADGMGGHAGGELASQIAVDTIAQELEKNDVSIHSIQDAIIHANYNICAYSNENTEFEGMGTTLVLAMIEQSNVVIANIGDSRAYYYDKQAELLRQISVDHSLVQELLQRNGLTTNRIKFRTLQNVITRCLGMPECASIDFFELEWNEGDLLLLCSDGLSDYVEDEIIEEVIRSGLDLDAMCDELIEKAKSEGGYDNITVAIAQNTVGGDLS